MNWSDERYVRLFTRDSITWLSWSWSTQAIFSLLLRKLDRAGVLDIGNHPPAEAVALILRAPMAEVERALADLQASETIVVGRHAIVFPKYREAQEAVQSDKARQVESRARRALDAANTRDNDDARHAVSRGVTPSHAVSLRAVPCRAVPNLNNNNVEPSFDDGGVAQELDQPTQPQLAGLNPEPAVDTTAGVPAGKRKRRPAVALTDDETDVFEHWRQTCNHTQAAATPERKALIAKQLKFYSVEQLQAAITGCAATPWNQGENPKRIRYDDLELILRDAKHIEGFAAKAHQ